MDRDKENKALVDKSVAAICDVYNSGEEITSSLWAFDGHNCRKIQNIEAEVRLTQIGPAFNNAGRIARQCNLKSYFTVLRINEEPGTLIAISTTAGSARSIIIFAMYASGGTAEEDMVLLEGMETNGVMEFDFQEPSNWTGARSVLKTTKTATILEFRPRR